MEPVALPLVEGDEPGLVYLLLPDFDPDRFQGIQYEIFEQRSVLNVYCYESGFEEDKNCEGIVFPIKLTEENSDAVKNLKTLRIVDPESANLDQLTDDDSKKITERYLAFKEDFHSV